MITNNPTGNPTSVGTKWAILHQNLYTKLLESDWRDWRFVEHHKGALEMYLGYHEHKSEVIKSQVDKRKEFYFSIELGPNNEVSFAKHYTIYTGETEPCCILQFGTSIPLLQLKSEKLVELDRQFQGDDYFEELKKYILEKYKEFILTGEFEGHHYYGFEDTIGFKQIKEPPYFSHEAAWYSEDTHPTQIVRTDFTDILKEVYKDWESQNRNFGQVSEFAHLILQYY